MKTFKILGQNTLPKNYFGTLDHRYRCCILYPEQFAEEIFDRSSKVHDALKKAKIGRSETAYRKHYKYYGNDRRQTNKYHSFLVHSNPPLAVVLPLWFSIGYP